MASKSSSYDILVWGEMDFSLSYAILQRWGSKGTKKVNMVATAYDSEEITFKKPCYVTDTKKNFAKMDLLTTKRNNINHVILCGIDATNVKQNENICKQYNNCKKFNKIFFGFPRHPKHTGHKENHQLMNGLFETASAIIDENSGVFYIFLHINKKGVSQLIDWNLKDCYQLKWKLKGEKIITREEMKQYLPEYQYRCYNGKTWKPHRIVICAFELKASQTNCNDKNEIESKMDDDSDTHTVSDSECSVLSGDSVLNLKLNDNRNDTEPSQTGSDKKYKKCQDAKEKEMEDTDRDYKNGNINIGKNDNCNKKSNDNNSKLKFTENGLRCMNALFGSKKKWSKNEQVIKSIYQCIDNGTKRQSKSNASNFTIIDDKFEIIAKFTDNGRQLNEIIQINKSNKKNNKSKAKQKRAKSIAKLNLLTISITVGYTKHGKTCMKKLFGKKWRKKNDKNVIEQEFIKLFRKQANNGKQVSIRMGQTGGIQFGEYDIKYRIRKASVNNISVRIMQITNCKKGKPNEKSQAQQRSQSKQKKANINIPTFENKDNNTGNISLSFTKNGAQCVGKLFGGNWESDPSVRLVIHAVTNGKKKQSKSNKSNWVITTKDLRIIVKDKGSTKHKTVWEVLEIISKNNNINSNIDIAHINPTLSMSTSNLSEESKVNVAALSNCSKYIQIPVRTLNFKYTPNGKKSMSAIFGQQWGRVRNVRDTLNECLEFGTWRETGNGNYVITYKDYTLMVTLLSSKLIEIGYASVVGMENVNINDNSSNSKQKSKKQTKKKKSKHKNDDQKSNGNGTNKNGSKLAQDFRSRNYGSMEVTFTSNAGNCMKSLFGKNWTTTNGAFVAKAIDNGYRRQSTKSKSKWVVIYDKYEISLALIQYHKVTQTMHVQVTQIKLK